MLDPPTEEEAHFRIGVRRDELGDLAEGVEALGQLTNDNRGPDEQLIGERQLAEPAVQPRSNRIVRQRLLAGDRVLMHSNVVRTMKRDGAERHGAIAVSDDDDLTGVRRLDGFTGLGQDKPVGRVDSHQVVGLEVGEAPQGLEVEGVVHPGQPASASRAVPRTGTRPQCGGRTSVWAGTSSWRTNPIGQVMPFGPWLQ